MRRDDRFRPKIVKIRAILAIFRLFEIVVVVDATWPITATGSGQAVQRLLRKPPPLSQDPAPCKRPGPQVVGLRPHPAPRAPIRYSVRFDRYCVRGPWWTALLKLERPCWRTIAKNKNRSGSRVKHAMNCSMTLTAIIPKCVAKKL